MATGVGRRTKNSLQQLPRSCLAAEGQQGEIEFSRTARVRDGIFLEETNTLTEGAISSLPIHDAEAAGKSHDNEVRLYRVVVEVEEQLQEAGGGTEERHFAAPEVGLERVEALPELVEVGRIANPAGNLKTFEVGGERTGVADDTVEHTGTLEDAGNLAAKAEMAKSGPVGGKYALRVTTGEGGGVETSESFLEHWHFDQPADQRRARTLTVSDSDADATHDFTIIGERLARAARPAGDLGVPPGRGRGLAKL